MANNQFNEEIAAAIKADHDARQKEFEKKRATSEKAAYEEKVSKYGKARADFDKKARESHRFIKPLKGSFRPSCEAYEYICRIFKNAINRNGGKKYEEYLYLRAGYKAYAIDMRRSLGDRAYIEQVMTNLPAEGSFFSLSTYCPYAKREKVEYAEYDQITDMFEPASFIKTNFCKATRSNTFCIFAFGIDIDYKKSRCSYKPEDPREFADWLFEEMDGLIPRPNIIEYGHNIRLMFVLSEPIYAKAKGSCRMVKALNKLVKYLCKVLNDRLDCCAEPQKQWLRIPGSINEKDGSTIHIEPYSDVEWSVQELISEYMPELEYSREELKKRKSTRRKGSAKTQKSSMSLQGKRMEDLVVLAENYGKNREETVFLYMNAWKQVNAGCTKEEFLKEALRFNSRFENPLKEKEVRSKLSSNFNREAYKFTNNTIMEMLCLDEATCRRLGLHLGKSKKAEDKKARAQRRAENALLKERRAVVIRGSYLAGNSAQEIADLVDTGISEVKSRIREIRASLSEEEKISLRQLQTQRKKQRIIEENSRKFAEFVNRLDNMLSSFKEKVSSSFYYIRTVTETGIAEASSPFSFEACKEAFPGYIPFVEKISGKISLPLQSSSSRASPCMMLV